MTTADSLLKLATEFEKLAAKEYAQLECECGNEWEALVPRGGKNGAPGRPNMICPKCGDIGWTRGKPRIELEPDVQSPPLNPEETKSMKDNMLRHVTELGSQLKPKFHTGQVVTYRGRVGKILDPLVHYNHPGSNMKDPSARYVTIQFNDTPLKMNGGRGNYTWALEKEVMPKAISTHPTRRDMPAVKPSFDAE